MSNYEIILVIVAVTMFVAGAVLIRRRDRISYSTMCLDLLCYCGGMLLVQTMLLASFRLYWTRGWEEDARQEYLGWVGQIPWLLWILIGVAGLLMFGGRIAITQRRSSPPADYGA